MPACIVAFHVTCAFDHGLEMRTILAENDEVRFKSFCLEHSAATATASSSATPPKTPATNGSHHSNMAIATAVATNGAHGTPTTPERFRRDSAHQPSVGHSTTGGGGGPANGRHGDPELRSGPALWASERAEREQLEREKVSQRKQKLQEMEDEFYRLVDPREVAHSLALPHGQVGPHALHTPHGQGRIWVV